MPETTSHQPYAELLKEFRQKVEFLKKEYHLEQRQIAASIGEYSTNFSRYLDIRRDRPCSLKKLLEMKTRMDELYQQELAFREAPEAARDMHSMLLSIQETLRTVSTLLTAFSDLVVGYIARSEKKPESLVSEELDRKKAANTEKTSK